MMAGWSRKTTIFLSAPTRFGVRFETRRRLDSVDPDLSRGPQHEAKEANHEEKVSMLAVSSSH
jgi:hypothetical protein